MAGMFERLPPTTFRRSFRTGRALKSSPPPTTFRRSFRTSRALKSSPPLIALLLLASLPVAAASPSAKRNYGVSGFDRVRLDEVNWLAAPIGSGGRCEVQLRYRSRAIPATVTDAIEASVGLRLDRPARAVAPGQSGVLYDPAGRVLGGGVIS